MDYKSLNDIIEKIEKEGDYEKKFIKYFHSLNLNNVRSTESDIVIYPGLQGYFPVAEEFAATEIPNYLYRIGFDGLFSFPVVHFEIMQGEMEDANVLHAIFGKDGFYIQGHILGTWDTDLEDKPLEKKFDLKDLRQTIKFLERVEHAYRFLY